MREVRSILSEFQPEGWVQTDTRVEYRIQESKWGGDGFPENDMVGMLQGQGEQVQTNADCIKYLYGYEEVDNPRVPDEIYYRWCKKPTTAEELYRRHSF